MKLSLIKINYLKRSNNIDIALQGFDSSYWYWNLVFFQFIGLSSISLWVRGYIGTHCKLIQKGKVFSLHEYVFSCCNRSIKINQILEIKWFIYDDLIL